MTSVDQGDTTVMRQGEKKEALLSSQPQHLSKPRIQYDTRMVSEGYSGQTVFVWAGAFLQVPGLVGGMILAGHWKPEGPTQRARGPPWEVPGGTWSVPGGPLRDPKPV